MLKVLIGDRVYGAECRDSMSRGQPQDLRQLTLRSVCRWPASAHQSDMTLMKHRVGRARLCNKLLRDILGSAAPTPCRVCSSGVSGRAQRSSTWLSPTALSLAADQVPPLLLQWQVGYFGRPLQLRPYVTAGLSLFSCGEELPFLSIH